jgi:hypothetical protein
MRVRQARFPEVASMNARFVTGCLTALVVGVIGSVSTDSRAGELDKSFSCSKQSDGSGTCQGSLSGLRNTTNASDFGGFIQFANDIVGASGQEFFVHFSNQFYTCTVATPGVRALWPVAAAGRGGFAITWDANAHCQYLEVDNESQFGYEKFE